MCCLLFILSLTGLYVLLPVEGSWFTWSVISSVCCLLNWISVALLTLLRNHPYNMIMENQWMPSNSHFISIKKKKHFGISGLSLWNGIMCFAIVDFLLWATQWDICISKPASFSPPWSVLQVSLPPLHPQCCTFLLKGASNVTYIREDCVRVLCCVICERGRTCPGLLCSSSDMAQRAFLKAINSVHIGDTDVLKSPFCCARWPQSAASEGLWWGDKWLHRASSSTPFSLLSYTLKMKTPHQPGGQRVGWIFDVGICVFSSQAQTVCRDTSWNI